MKISYERLPNAGKTIPVYLVKQLFVLLNYVLTMKYILLNVKVMNYAVIEFLMDIHMYASVR